MSRCQDLVLVVWGWFVVFLFCLFVFLIIHLKTKSNFLLMLEMGQFIVCGLKALLKV